MLLNGAPVDDDWVVVTDGWIEINPSLNVPSGEYDFILAARMADYRNITVMEPFTVYVANCQTGLDMNGAFLENQARTWY